MAIGLEHATSSDCSSWSENQTGRRFNNLIMPPFGKETRIEDITENDIEGLLRSIRAMGNKETSRGAYQSLLNFLAGVSERNPFLPHVITVRGGATCT